MDSQDILQYKKEISYFLSKRQIKNAFGLLSKLAKMHDWQMSEKLNDLETSYKYMLHYLFEGVQDNQREEVYRNMLRSLYEMNDDLTDELLKPVSSNIFHEMMRMEDIKPEITLNDLHASLKNITDSLSLIDLMEDNEEKARRRRELAVKRERLGIDIFNKIFVSGRANEFDLESYLSFVDSIDLFTREKCLFISALTLNLFYRFDSRKMQVLLHVSSSDNIALCARALVGLIITLQIHNERWDLYPHLKEMLNIRAENPSFRRSFLRVIIQLIRSRETEKISKKVTEEIIPEMMRFNSLAGRKLNMEDLMSDIDFSDKNPEWKKELDDSGLVDKLQEYSNLQMEGADVFHSTFSSLKSFPFFSEMGNWFMPFDTSYSEFQLLFPENSQSNLLKMAIVDSNHMCDSDKYSFCLSLLQISIAQREMMMRQLGAESEQIKQLQKDAKEMDAQVDEEVISNQYIQNLYRFFKLFPYKNNFQDIFKLSINFYDINSIEPLISDPDSMNRIASYCFEKNNFKEALDIFERLQNISVDDNDLWQKIGYCRQMLDDREGALDAYFHADALSPNNSWILKRIAQLYRSLKNPQMALEYYKKASDLMPDNLNLELNIGHCYLELKDYDKALNSYFKVEVLDTKGEKAWRPIAWVSFLLKKFDVSRNYYKKILAVSPTIHDFLNSGHVELCTGNMHDAIDFYTQAADKEANFDSFRILFNADIHTLENCGFDKQILPYILDQVQYNL